MSKNRDLSDIAQGTASANSANNLTTGSSAVVANASGLYVNSAVFLGGSNGAVGQVLTSNGSGNVYWSTVASSGNPFTSTNNINIGLNSSANLNSVSIGGLTGNTNQNSYSVAIGWSAGSANQNGYAVAVGANAGFRTQNLYTVAIGYNSGSSNQNYGAVSFGAQSAYQNQNLYSIAIGYAAGYSNQSYNSIAIGANSAYSNQNHDAIAIGSLAGGYAQNTFTVAVGYQAGYQNQNTYGVAIGYSAGYFYQNNGAVAIGQNAGYSYQQRGSIAIGGGAGQTNQATYAIAIGVNAGTNTQNSYSVAIGYSTNVQHTSAIVISGNTTGLSSSNTGLFIDPIRNDSTPTNVIYYNTTTKELSYGAAAPGVNTASQYTFTNTITFSNTITIGAISANGGTGTANQYLTSNGTSTYWSSPALLQNISQQFTGDGTSTAFAVTGGYQANSIQVYMNGSLMRSGTDVTITSGNNVVFATAPPNGALIDVYGISNLYANLTNSSVSQQFTANGSANSFTVTGGYIPSSIQVYLNGVKQIPGTDVIITSGNTVNFTVTPANNYIVDVFGYAATNLGAIQYQAQARQSFVATAGQTTFTVTGGYAVGYIDVYQNGVKLLNGTDVTVTSGTNVVLATGASVNDIIDVVAYPTLYYTDMLKKSGDTMTGNLTFSGTGLRILGDFSNPTVVNSVAFQTSTTNGFTLLNTLPNGTSTISGVRFFSGTDPDNSSLFQIIQSGTSSALYASKNGTGTYGPMTFLTGGSERMRIDSSGNIGIGTAFPNYLFDVYKSTAAVQRIYSETSATSIVANYSTDTVGPILQFSKYRGGSSVPTTVVSGDISGRLLSYGYDGTTLGQVSEIRSVLDGTVSAGSTPGRLVFYTTTSGSATASEKMRIDSAGNIGIGVVPSYQLEVKSANDAILRFVNSGATQVSQIQSTNLARSAYAPLSIGGSYTVLETGGSERMRIDSSGNMGLGGSPARKLDVYGGARFVQDAAATTGAIVLRQNSGDTVGGYIQWVNNANAVEKGWMVVDTSSNMIFATGSTERMRIDSSGRMTLPYQPAAVIHGAGAWTSYTDNTVLVFTDSDYNVGSNYSTSTGRFTAPVTGYYFVYAQAYFSGATTAGRLSIFKNGSQLFLGHKSNTNDASTTVSGVIYCAASDYIDIRNILYSIQIYMGRSHTFLSVYMLG